MTMPIVAVGHPRRYPPRVTEFTRPFWDALSLGRFLVTRCQSCGHHSFPPKPICAKCWTDRITWDEIETLGVIYSWTRVYAGPAIFDADLPYAIGVVDLDCGVRLAAPLVGDGPWNCGMKIELVSMAFEDGPLVGARPKNGFA